MKANDDSLQLQEIVKFYWYTRMSSPDTFLGSHWETQEIHTAEGKETDFKDMAHQILLASKPLREVLLLGVLNSGSVENASRLEIQKNVCVHLQIKIFLQATSFLNLQTFLPLAGDHQHYQTSLLL